METETKSDNESINYNIREHITFKNINNFNENTLIFYLT